MEISKPGKSVYVQMGVWYEPNTNQIHLTAKNVAGFHTTVSGNPSSEQRWHPNLFNKLAELLREAGAPAPEPVDGHSKLGPKGGNASS